MTKTDMMKYLRKLSRAVLSDWRLHHEPYPKVDCFGRWTAPASDYFVSCKYCEQAGAKIVSHDDDCPVVIARKILKGKATE